MTNDEHGSEETLFDPASMAIPSLISTKAVWYKRPWILVSVGVALVVAVSIATDIAHRTTNTEDAATQNSTIKQINGDVAACAFAASESFRLYNDFSQRQLTPSELSQATKLLVDDRTACSFASEPIYDLTNTVEPVETSAGTHIDRMLIVSRTWMTDYALSAIVDIQHLFAHPGSASTLDHLSSLEVDLSAERALAVKDVDEAQQILGLPLTQTALPVLPHLVGTA